MFVNSKAFSRREVSAVQRFYRHKLFSTIPSRRPRKQQTHVFRARRCSDALLPGPMSQRASLPARVPLQAPCPRTSKGPQGGIWLNFTLGVGHQYVAQQIATKRNRLLLCLQQFAIYLLLNCSWYLLLGRCPWFLLLGQAKGTWVLTCAWSWLGVEFFKIALDLTPCPQFFLRAENACGDAWATNVVLNSLSINPHVLDIVS